MARTRRIGNTRDGRSFDCPHRRPWYCTESKTARKSTNRTNRQTAKALLSRDDFDPDSTIIPEPPSTGGWLTH